MSGGRLYTVLLQLGRRERQWWELAILNKLQHISRRGCGCKKAAIRLKHRTNPVAAFVLALWPWQEAAAGLSVLAKRERKRKYAKFVQRKWNMFISSFPLHFQAILCWTATTRTRPWIAAAAEARSRRRPTATPPPPSWARESRSRCLGMGCRCGEVSLRP